MRFLVDENFNNRILRGIRRENADVDIVRAYDTDVYQVADPELNVRTAESEYSDSR